MGNLFGSPKAPKLPDAPTDLPPAPAPDLQALARQRADLRRRKNRNTLRIDDPATSTTGGGGGLFIPDPAGITR